MSDPLVNCEGGMPADPVKALPDVAIAMQRAFNLGQNYWQQADSDSYSVPRDTAAQAAPSAPAADLPEVPNTFKAPGETDDQWIDRITGAAPAVPVAPEGWRWVRVKGLDDLCAALDRAARKGYIPDAMADEWAAFQYIEHTAPQAPQAVPPAAPKDHEIAALVTTLRDIAVAFHGHESLRQRISLAVVPMLKRALPADAQDAARYRWLRASACLDGPHIYGPDDDCILDGEDADAAIDAAMAKVPT